MLLIFDEYERLVATLDNEIEEGAVFWDAAHTQEINGENTLEFTTLGSHPDAVHVVEKNKVGFFDLENNFQLFEIVEVEDAHDGSEERLVSCDHVFYELKDGERIGDIRPSNVSARFALERALETSHWEVGNVDDLGTHSTNFYRENPLSAVNTVANTWQGELRFRVEVVGNEIVGRYVDLFARLGADTGKVFEYGKDIESLKRTGTTANLVTALYGYGKGEEVGDGHGRRITFADVEWSTDNGDPVDKPLGQNWVGDPDALERHGRVINGVRVHRFDDFEDSDEEDPAELLMKTWEHLQTINDITNNYDLNAINLEDLTDEFGDSFDHERARIGDTTPIIIQNYHPPVLVKVRIFKTVDYIGEPERRELEHGTALPLFTDDERLDHIEAKVNDRAGIWDDKYTPGQPLDTAWLDGIIDVLQNEVRSTGGYVYMTDEEGLIVYDQPVDGDPTQAIQLKGGILAIANERDPVTGDWNWRTFGTGDGFTADELNAGEIQTSLIRIFGDTSFYWDGSNLFIMDPNNSNRQIRIGNYDGTNYGIGFTEDGGQSFFQTIDFNGLVIGSSTGFESGYDPSEKETPQGAQQKVNTALTQSKSYVREYARFGNTSNLCPNPSFELFDSNDKPVEWSINEEEVSVSAYMPYSGQHSLSVRHGGRVDSFLIPVTPDDELYLRLAMFANSGSDVRFGLRYSDEDQSFLTFDWIESGTDWHSTIYNTYDGNSVVPTDARYVQVTIECIDGQSRFDSVNLEKVNFKSGSGSTIIDSDGVLVNEGNFRLRDERTQIESVLQPNSNMLNDHSFEKIPTQGSADSHLTYQVNLQTDYANAFTWDASSPSNARVLSTYGSGAYQTALFDYQALECVHLDDNYWRQYVFLDQSVGLDGPYTFSAYFAAFSATQNDTNGILAIQAYDADFNWIEDVIQTQVPINASEQYVWKRGACTAINLPSNTEYIRVRISSSGNRILCDGAQLVPFSRPAKYEAESSVWRALQGLPGYGLHQPILTDPLVAGNMFIDGYARAAAYTFSAVGSAPSTQTGTIWFVDGYAGLGWYFRYDGGWRYIDATRSGEIG